jgi:hypothetical protein
MQDLKIPAGPDAVAPAKDPIRIEIFLPGAPEPKALALPAGGDVLERLRRTLGLAEDVYVFELDDEKPLKTIPQGRKALRLVAHPARQIEVTVRYEHDDKSENFAPAKTVFKVLQWAVSKKAYNLDPSAAARANLILPDADQPLPRDVPIGAYVPPGAHQLVVDLTLKDFTNG